jgi:isoleucyl-tRNA synthetase
MDELNIKEIIVMKNEGQVANFQIKPNLQLLGPKFGADLPTISKLITNCDTYEVSRKVLNNQKVTLGEFELDPSDLILEIVDLEGYASVMEANYIVTVETTISSELADEGITREVVHIVQSMRRSAGFEISDRIVLWYQAEEKIQKVIKNHEQYIREETLSKDIVLGRSEDGSHVEEHAISGEDIILGVKLAN